MYASDSSNFLHDEDKLTYPFSMFSEDDIIAVHHEDSCTWSFHLVASLGKTTCDLSVPPLEHFVRYVQPESWDSFVNRKSSPRSIFFSTE